MLLLFHQSRNVSLNIDSRPVSNFFVVLASACHEEASRHSLVVKLEAAVMDCCLLRYVSASL